MTKMNLYLVLALALGAATPAPIAPPAAARIVSMRRDGGTVCGRTSMRRISNIRVGRAPSRLAPRAPRLVNTGSATPRAPAAI